MGDTTAPRSTMAAAMVGMPVVWRRLLAAHVPDRSGRCTGCRTSSGSGPLWPCTLHQVAAEAERMHERELGRAVAADSAETCGP